MVEGDRKHRRLDFAQLVLPLLDQRRLLAGLRQRGDEARVGRGVLTRGRTPLFLRLGRQVIEAGNLLRGHADLLGDLRVLPPASGLVHTLHDRLHPAARRAPGARLLCENQRRNQNYQCRERNSEREFSFHRRSPPCIRRTVA